MRKREILELLNKVLVDASMERANFSHILDCSPYPTNEYEVTRFIKDRTRLYRQSWIIAPLERVVRLIEQDGARQHKTAAQLTQLEDERD